MVQPPQRTFDQRKSAYSLALLFSMCQSLAAAQAQVSNLEILDVQKFSEQDEDRYGYAWGVRLYDIAMSKPTIANEADEFEKKRKIDELKGVL